MNTLLERRAENCTQFYGEITKTRPLQCEIQWGLKTFKNETRRVERKRRNLASVEYDTTFITENTI